MSILYYSYILVAMRIVDIITRTTANNWMTTVLCDAIQHIRVEI